jgi:hypothetical protein
MQYASADRVRRTIILIQMESGMEHAYELTGPEVQITHEWDDNWTFIEPYERYQPRAHYATLEARGVLRGLVQWADAFEPEAIEPARPELNP